MAKISYDTRCSNKCATCQEYQGNREYTNNGFVVVESNSYGYCKKLGRQMSCNNSCNSHK